MFRLKPTWNRWTTNIYACDICFLELEKKKNYLVCPKCLKYWHTDKKKGVLRFAGKSSSSESR
jgi:ribosomal protein L28